MTKEKIIINGIDVTECNYRRQNPHNFCMCASVINESGIELTRYVQCEYNPNCYFKQLKRKEQECGELKDHIKFIQETNNLLYSEKKDIFMNIDNIIKEFEIESIKDVKTGKIIYRSKKLLKYKSALEEIEKYCEEQNLKYDNTACDILNIINNTEENNTMNTNEPNQKEMQFIYGERKGCTAIYAIDKPSPNNNSYHEFIINHEPDSETSELLGRIKLQNGNFAEFGHNGIFTEHLLVIARDCLERFNTSKYACQENSIAINSINNALMWLNKRATERVKRGVYGTETV